jgi:hypothetical protein
VVVLTLIVSVTIVAAALVTTFMDTRIPSVLFGYSTYR